MIRILPLFALSIFIAPSLFAGDWPSWRGPNGDGVARETGWQIEWPESDPPILWKASVGTGFSSFAVADGRVFTMGNSRDKDTVWCFDARTGREIWSHSYDEPLAPKFYEGGTSGTPTVDGNQVYTLSRRGEVFCFDAATGEIQWNRNVQKETGADLPDWGFAGSPRIYEDLLLLNVGDSGLALNKSDGSQVWFSDAAKAGYSTPYLYESDGQTLAVLSSGREYVARVARSGEEVWRYKWLTKYGVNAADPIYHQGEVFISTDYGKGATLIDVAPVTPTEVWRNKEMETQMNPCIFLDGALFGCSGNEGDRKLPLKAVDWKTGETLWSFPSVGAGSVLASQDHLIVLSARGELMFAPVSREKFEPVFQMQVLGGKCWTVPVLAHGLIYCRNSDGDVVCIDLNPS